MGAGHKNNQACAGFVDCIGQAQKEALGAQLAKAKFFSIQADGSTDSANIEDELYLLVYFDPLTNDGVVHVRNKFFTVRRPARSNAEGLYECFVRALNYVGVTDWENRLVGFGCDGASVNMGANGLRGYLEKAVPWVFVFWCLAHRLELALKDALKATLFTTIDDMLLRLYFLYEKSPKKRLELDAVVVSLRECLESTDLPMEGGNRPLRACGTRFITHKVAAIGRLLDRYGAYIAHLTSLTEDSSVRLADRQRIKGYLLKWAETKIVLGCALFHDILKPAAIMCKGLQDDELCVVGAIEAVLKTAQEITCLQDMAFEDLPTVKKVLARLQKGSGCDVTYQGATLKQYDQGVAFLQSHKNEYVHGVVSCLKERIKVQNCDVLTHALTLLATQGWEKNEYGELSAAALNGLSSHFSVPLEKSGVDCGVLEEEWLDMHDYAKRYLNLATENYRIIWWKLFNAPTSSKWRNILALIELLFCFPMANGRLERVFSSLKLIKSDRRSRLGKDRLDHLVRIAVDGPPLNQWDATDAVQLWWRSCFRRQGQDKTRVVGTPSTSTTQDNSSDAIYPLNLEDWDIFLA